MVKVYFTRECNSNGLRKVLEKLNYKKDAKTGIKTHFGEENNDTYPNPMFIKDNLDILPKDISFIESNVLYKGRRTIREEHIKLAKEHGFGFLPIHILDGRMGEEQIEVEINKKHFKKVKLGKGIIGYDQIIVYSHFKGHIMAGFGGAIKNIGMGIASRQGKLEMHSNVSPRVKILKCIACGQCAKHCPANAITIQKKARIDSSKCIGCSMCIAVCPVDAISIPWMSVTKDELQERICEYALGVIKLKKCYFINLLMNITKECDCMDYKQKPFMDDIGILASEDPVAIDYACYELITNKLKYDPFKKYNHTSGLTQINYGEKIGLGSKDYELVVLD